MGAHEPVNESDVNDLVNAIQLIPDVVTPAGYDDIDLAVIDSIYSIGIRYTTVVNVLDAYREKFLVTGTVTGLIEAIDTGGGPTAFADNLNNRNRTSITNGILKSQAVRDAAEALAQGGVETHTNLQRMHKDDELGTIKSSWTRVKGQRSGISWVYFLILNRIDDVTTDRMVRRFCTRVIGADLTDNQLALAVEAAATKLGQSARHVDHRIWRYERRYTVTEVELPEVP